MNTQEVISMFSDFVIANYGRLPKVITKGQNNTLRDLDGNDILDMFPGWAVSGIGHCHPKVVEAVRKQAGELLHIDNTFYTIEQGQLAKMLSERAFGGQSFFCNSGAEANEAALKLARRHTPREKYKFITAEKSFHGRTLATVTATGQPQYHDGFLPLLPGFVYVPYNNIDALHEAFDDDVCAVMVEPILGEGGVHEATPEYLQTIRDLCDEHNIDDP
jgi:acetylornithine/succinyldiaminopimelate/putrescine aminotransferase